MSERIDQFCENLRVQLNAIESRLAQVGDSIKAAPKEAEAAIRSKIDAAKAQYEERKQKVAAAKSKLEERLQAKKDEVETEIQEWKTNREIQKLDRRAEKAEEYAVAAIEFAAAAVAEADLAAEGNLGPAIASDIHPAGLVPFRPGGFGTGPTGPARPWASWTDLPWHPQGSPGRLRLRQSADRQGGAP